MPIARETLLEFPCVFPLKVIGRNVAEFEGEVLTIIQKHVPDAQRENVTPRPSAEQSHTPPDDRSLRLRTRRSAHRRAIDPARDPVARCR